MSLIDSTYFVYDINLPAGTYSELANVIARYEPEILKRLLGYELYKDMVANPSDARWVAFISGVEYTVDYDGRDQIIKWNGLINNDKISLIAYYVYYWYLRNQASITNNVGEIKPSQENSFNAESVAKAMNAYTRLIDLYGCAGQSELIPSAYNFLNENEDTYPEWVFKSLGKVNSHDL